MKKILIYIAIMAILLSVVFLKKSAVKPIQPDYNAELIKNGDLIFRKGRGIFSDLFCAVGREKSPYSHAGIINVSDNQLFVIHTEASELTGIGFAKRERLAHFIDENNAAAAAIYRLNGVSDSCRHKAVQTALEYVRKKIPFDLGFDLSTAERLYCTELICAAYKNAGLILVDQPFIFKTPNSQQQQKEVISIGQLLNNHLLIFITKLK